MNDQVPPPEPHVGPDRDRVEGAAKTVIGSVKEAVGHLIGDSKLEADGQAEKLVGKAQNALGGAKDAARDAMGKLKL